MFVVVSGYLGLLKTTMREVTRCPERNTGKANTAADSAVDKLQEYRRSKGKPDLLDKAIDNAQEAGLVNKAFDTLKRRFIGR